MALGNNPVLRVAAAALLSGPALADKLPTADDLQDLQDKNTRTTIVNDSRGKLGDLASVTRVTHTPSHQAYVDGLTDSDGNPVLAGDETPASTETLKYGEIKSTLAKADFNAAVNNIFQESHNIGEGNYAGSSQVDNIAELLGLDLRGFKNDFSEQPIRILDNAGELITVIPAGDLHSGGFNFAAFVATSVAGHKLGKPGGAIQGNGVLPPRL